MLLPVAHTCHLPPLLWFPPRLIFNVITVIGRRQICLFPAVRMLPTAVVVLRVVSYWLAFSPQDSCQVTFALTPILCPHCCATGIGHMLEETMLSCLVSLEAGLCLCPVSLSRTSFLPQLHVPLVLTPSSE